MFEQTTDINCPECGDPAEDRPPTDWRVPGEVPGYRHVGDRAALCPVMTRDGDCPAEPVERADPRRHGRGGRVMAATTTRRAGKTPEERAAEVEALAEQPNTAVAELTTSEAWLAMLRVSARFTRCRGGSSGLFEVRECRLG